MGHEVGASVDGMLGKRAGIATHNSSNDKHHKR